jgi:aminoglycoside 6'-N-acetyltransferase-1b/aminoglycoside 6'-N-acetyltransferase-2
MDISIVEFRPLREADLPLLHDWLNRPHLRAWWDSAPPSQEDVREKYLPRVGDQNVLCYLAYLRDTPIGYIQSYVAAAVGGGWWPDERDPGVVGIDQFLADPAQLGHGLGTAMVSRFVAQLFKDPRVTRIQADPRPDNTRAIRCYENAGFIRVGPITTPDGQALLMVCDRPSK